MVTEESPSRSTQATNLQPWTLQSISYSNAAPFFEYQPLPINSIRLLRILPSEDPSFHTSQICVSLDTVNLDSGIAYDCLSYTWDPPTIKQERADSEQIFTTVSRCYPVRCGQRILLATRNLRDALRSLRVLDRPEGKSLMSGKGWNSRTDYLWADALCIDQCNLDERSQQVRLMWDIYRKAKSVFAWLGEHDQYSPTALQAIRELTKLRRKLTNAQDDAAETSEETFERVGLKSLSARSWDCWTRFMNRKLFTRTWVIQEVALGEPDNVYCICGNTLTRLETVLESAFLLQSAISRLKLHRALEQYNLPDTNIEDLKWLLKGPHPFYLVLSIWDTMVNGSRPSFFSLNRMIFQQAHCTDPRDKIYGAASIVSEFQSSDGDPFIIDYRLPVDEVYCYATKFACNKMRALDLLATVSHRPISGDEPINGLPSWCPDYSLPVSGPGSMLLYQGDDCQWAACGPDTVLRSIATSEMKQLQVVGSRCDSVVRHTKSPRWYLDLSVLEDVLSILLTLEMPKYSHTEMLWRTMVCDDFDRDNLENSRPPANLSTAILYRAWLTNSLAFYRLENSRLSAFDLVDRLDKAVTQLEATDGAARQVWPSFRAILDSIEAEPDKHALEVVRHHYNYVDERGVKDFIQTVHFNCGGRDLFTTTHQRLGMSLQGMGPGDEVWLLQGSKVPFLLRPTTKGNYQLVGEAYVHGIMFGEAWPTDPSALKTIVLE